MFGRLGIALSRAGGGRARSAFMVGSSLSGIDGSRGRFMVMPDHASSGRGFERAARRRLATILRSSHPPDLFAFAHHRSSPACSIRDSVIYPRVAPVLGERRAPGFERFRAVTDTTPHDAVSSGILEAYAKYEERAAVADALGSATGALRCSVAPSGQRVAAPCGSQASQYMPPPPADIAVL
jgi:hypothetical protein